MNITTMNASVSQEAARAALREYKQHRSLYDKRDWEIERIYRAIAKGKKVISAFDAIRRGGITEDGFPRLALMRADQEFCRCNIYSAAEVVFSSEVSSFARDRKFTIHWPDRAVNRTLDGRWHGRAMLPRIPPKYRPPTNKLSGYHLLWEAEWTPVPPRDPYLLKRIGKDAWVVLAAWDLTDVEISVLRAHQ